MCMDETLDHVLEYVQCRESEQRKGSDTQRQKCDRASKRLMVVAMLLCDKTQVKYFAKHTIKNEIHTCLLRS